VSTALSRDFLFDLLFMSSRDRYWSFLRFFTRRKDLQARSAVRKNKNFPSLPVRHASPELIDFWIAGEIPNP
jgi:hypothetical protein